MPGSEHHTPQAKEPLEAYCLRIGIIPLLSVRWCSVEWKRKPISKYKGQNGILIDHLGICADEPRRVRDGSYPLYEEGITREGCKRIIRDAGLEVPRKSGCFFCPGQRVGEWQRLYYEHPDLYGRAVRMEDVATEHRRNGSTASLDPDGVPLREMARRRWEGQTEMDLSEWLPCLCSL
jgi:hypothetical protein